GDGSPSPIIHRDVSPANVVLGYDGQVKLVDFGVAKALYPHPEDPRTQAGILKGKLGYMAPEQVDGLSVPQSGIFATGVVLCEMLTLRRLIKGENPFDTLARLKTMPFQAPSKVAANVPAVLDAIALKALDRDLDLRYASAAVMAKELDLLVQAAGFSVEAMRAFMPQVYPNEIQTAPSITGVWGVSGVSVGVPVATGTPLPHAQHAQLAPHTQSHSLGTQATRTSALGHTQP